MAALSNLAENIRTASNSGIALPERTGRNAIVDPRLERARQLCIDARRFTLFYYTLQDRQKHRDNYANPILILCQSGVLCVFWTK